MAGEGDADSEDDGMALLSLTDLKGSSCSRPPPVRLLLRLFVFFSFLVSSRCIFTINDSLIFRSFSLTSYFKISIWMFGGRVI